MIDPDVQLPRLRERLQQLCQLLGDACDAASRASLSKRIEDVALEIGLVYAVDLVNQGWKPDVHVSRRQGAAKGVGASPIAA